MAMENLCDFIIKTKDIQEIKSRLDNLELPLVYCRDDHGNSMLHLVVQSECSLEKFSLLLNYSNLAIRNDEFKLAQDLFCGKTLEKEYEMELVDHLVDKLRNCEGELIRSLIIQGWNHKPYLIEAIDMLNDNFISYVLSIENLLDIVKQCAEKVVNQDYDSWESLVNIAAQSDLKIEEVMLMRMQCGLTLIHVAVLYGRHNLVIEMIEICLEKNLVPTDHMDRTVFHYLYAIKTFFTAAGDIIDKMKTHEQLNCVDVLGKVPEYYEYFPENLSLDYCREFVKTDLMNFRIMSSKRINVHLKPKICETKTESTYLKQTVEKALVKAFALVVEKRPIDPIDFLGNFLKFYSTHLSCSKYDYDQLSSRMSISLSPPTSGSRGCEKSIFTFNAEIFSPFAKVARDKNGTPLSYKLLIKKLKTYESSEIDWFEIVRGGLNFALRDCNGNTLLELALGLNFSNIKNELDSVLLALINEENLQALKNLYSCGYFENFPDIYDICGPDLFGVSPEIAEFYTALSDVYKNNNILFSVTGNDMHNQLNWSDVITNDMTAYSFSKTGMSVIHYALASNNSLLIDFLVSNFPGCLKLKDCYNRNVFHYCAAFGIERYKEFEDFYPEGLNEFDCFDNPPEYYHCNNDFQNLA